MGELTGLDPSAPFYAGLLHKAANDGPERRAALFEAALESPLGPVREAAAEELLGLLLEGEDSSFAEGFLARIKRKKSSPITMPHILTLRAGALYRLGRFKEVLPLYPQPSGGSSWDRAFFLAASLRLGGGGAEDLSGFFLSGSPGPAQRWALGELRHAGGDFLSAGERAAIEGRLALARSSFNEGLDYFRAVLEEDEGLFFRYPDLLGDLGRAFQFTAAGDEGTELFLAWDRRIQGGTIPVADTRRIRYLLLYFAGRMQRQAGRNDHAAELFTRALAFAPDALQKDACIWYILSLGLADKPQDTVSLLRTYAPLWSSPPYFADILDRLSRSLTADRRWEAMAEVFSLIRENADGGTLAKYAYIIGRAMAEGYIAGDGPGDRASAEDFFRIAFEEGNASWYYRALGAFYLGENVVPIPAGPEEGSGGKPSPKDLPHGEDLEFLLGFFEFGVPDQVFSYLEDDMDRFTIPELRTLAEAFAGVRRWAESIRVVSAYMGREEYAIQRRDMELLYPRPFADLIETYARQADLPVEILYGLVRTESAFVPDIHSRAGAVGLTQLMPATALEMAGRVRRQGGPDYIREGEIDLSQPELNIHLGAVYLRYLMNRMESPLSALLAYNGGIGRVRRWRAAEDQFPEDLFLETIEYAETREYGRKVLAAAAAYGYLYYDMTMEALIADIFK
jgi:soluble lytic murein transglycosylase